MNRTTIMKILLAIAIAIALVVLFTKAAAEDREYRKSELYQRAKALQLKSREPDWIGAPLSFTEAKQRVEFLMNQEGEVKK